MQEASEADLLLHVIDAAAEDRDETIFQVNQVLKDIDADKVPQLRIYNKIDLLEHVDPHIDYGDDEKPVAVWISAQQNLGCDLLQQALNEIFAETKVRRQCLLHPSQLGIKAKLFNYVQIISEEIDTDGNTRLIFDIDQKNLGLIKNMATEAA